MEAYDAYIRGNTCSTKLLKNHFVYPQQANPHEHIIKDNTYINLFKKVGQSTKTKKPSW